MIAGCEAAWAFYGGVFKVLIPDNIKAMVAKADAVNPVLTQGWLDYAQHCGSRHRPGPGPNADRTSRGWSARFSTCSGNFWAGSPLWTWPTRRRRAVDLVRA